MKRTRKQPRRMTPPLILRNADAERTAVMVDEELVLERPHTSGRIRAYLSLGAGLRIQLGSRCINKHRIQVIRILRSDQPDPPAPEYDAYRAASALMADACSR